MLPSLPSQPNSLAKISATHTQTHITLTKTGGHSTLLPVKHAGKKTITFTLCIVSHRTHMHTDAIFIHTFRIIHCKYTVTSHIHTGTNKHLYILMRHGFSQFHSPKITTTASVCWHNWFFGRLCQDYLCFQFTDLKLTEPGQCRHGHTPTLFLSEMCVCVFLLMCVYVCLYVGPSPQSCPFSFLSTQLGTDTDTS